MSNSPLVSIITVAFNSEKTICHTIESVLTQTYDNIEYWIIDGDSRDRTVEIAESSRVQMENKGIHYYILSEPDGGIYDAMNKGIRKATGEIIGIINSDDWYEPEAVETAVDTFHMTGCDLMLPISVCTRRMAAPLSRQPEAVDSRPPGTGTTRLPS